MALVAVARSDLTELYALNIDTDDKRSRKLEILNALSNDAEKLVASSGTSMRNWLAAPLNNARLVSINLYEGRSNAFSALMEECDRDFACFYERANEIASMRDKDRDAALNALSDEFDERVRAASSGALTDWKLVDKRLI